MKQTNTGRIIKAKVNVNYTIIPNGILKNKNLSLEAKGLLCLILSLPEDWIIYKTQLQDFSSCGRDKTIKAFNQLIEVGYIVGEKIVNSKGQFQGWNYIVYPEIPAGDTNKPIPENPISDNPISEKPNSENQVLLIKEKQNKEKQNKEIKNKKYNNNIYNNTSIENFSVEDELLADEFLSGYLQRKL